ncbi:nuclear transport factor 2 family protein [Modicisalibacter radicis]
MELVSPSTRRSIERLDELIADDFEEFGSSGRVIRKKDLLDFDGPSPKYELDAFSVRLLGEGVALVKYSAKILGSVSYRSSVWVKSRHRWQLLHHQSTVVPNDV